MNSVSSAHVVPFTNVDTGGGKHVQSKADVMSETSTMPNIGIPFSEHEAGFINI